MSCYVVQGSWHCLASKVVTKGAGYDYFRLVVHVPYEDMKSWGRLYTVLTQFVKESLVPKELDLNKVQVVFSVVDFLL